jgi:hypothetical protein
MTISKFWRDVTQLQRLCFGALSYFGEPENQQLSAATFANNHYWARQSLRGRSIDDDVHWPALRVGRHHGVAS